MWKISKASKGHEAHIRVRGHLILAKGSLGLQMSRGYLWRMMCLAAWAECLVSGWRERGWALCVSLVLLGCGS